MAIWRRILLIGFILLLLAAAINALDVFPLPGDDAIMENSKGFSGVLRLWISEEKSPSPSGLSTWLTKESAQFEKKHDGVYVQITPVSKETLASFSYAAELPPDMIVFSPGMLENAQGLTETDAARLLRKEFSDYADGLCTPVAMGAAFWAIREGIDPPLSGKTLLIDQEYAYSALYALKSDLNPQKTPGAGYGVDLGLPIYEHQSDDIIIEETGELRPGANSHVSENACISFINGEGDAAFVSNKALSTLTNAKSAPEFRIAVTGEIYADLLSLFAVTDTKTGEAREMCVRFLEHLLSEDAQKRLESTKAFSVTDANLYAGKRHYQEIEMNLSSSKVIPAPAFSDSENDTAEALRSVIHGESRLSDILSGMP